MRHNMNDTYQIIRTDPTWPTSAPTATKISTWPKIEDDDALAIGGLLGWSQGVI